MDSITLGKQNRLFWLGRYSERVYTTLQFLLGQYDRYIDGAPIDYAAFCGRMGIPCPYESTEDFVRTYLFSPDDPNSIRSSVDQMLGNGMVLRETISTPTLAYLQMAQGAIEMAEQSAGPTVELQWVLDDIMAFRGSFDDSVDLESARNITKAGFSVERLSLMLRLNWQPERLERELRKLLNRLYKTDLPTDKQARESVARQALHEEPVDPKTLLAGVEGLFQV